MNWTVPKPLRKKVRSYYIKPLTFIRDKAQLPKISKIFFKIKQVLFSLDCDKRSFIIKTTSIFTRNDWLLIKSHLKGNLTSLTIAHEPRNDREGTRGASIRSSPQKPNTSVIADSFSPRLYCEMSCIPYSGRSIPSELYRAESGVEWLVRRRVLSAEAFTSDHFSTTVSSSKHSTTV